MGRRRRLFERQSRPFFFLFLFLLLLLSTDIKFPHPEKVEFLILSVFGAQKRGE